MLARLASTVPGPQSAAAGRRAPRSAKTRLFVRAVCPCCIELCLQSLLGFLPVTHCDQRNIFFLLCCITWLLFSCCCFFPPAFVAVGCSRGQVTGQDVPLLRRYGHANKLRSFQELFRALEGDGVYPHTVSTAPGTALTCTTSSPSPVLGAAEGQDPSQNVRFRRVRGCRQGRFVLQSGSGHAVFAQAALCGCCQTPLVAASCTRGSDPSQARGQVSAAELASLLSHLSGSGGLLEDLVCRSRNDALLQLSALWGRG